MTDGEKWAGLIAGSVSEDAATAAFLALQEAVNGQSRAVIVMAAAMLLGQQIGAHGGDMAAQSRAGVIVLMDQFTKLAIRDQR
jgi:hypothetical protein